ncbi:MAG: CvpA family protein [Duncaniella sp.]|nr:CvpA family protein [Duncaniella sp.]
METLDIVLIVMAAAGAIMGWMSGFIGQIASLAALVAGVVACRCKGDEFAAWLGPMIAPDTADTLLVVSGCNIVLFIVVYIIVMIAAYLLRTILKIAFMGPLDSLAGAVFGVFKWWFLGGVLLGLWAFVQPSAAAAIQHDTLAACVRDGALWLLGVGINTVTQ